MWRFLTKNKTIYIKVNILNNILTGIKLKIN